MALLDAELTPQLIQRLAKTAFCESGIAELADLFHDMPIERANRWVEQLTEMGEDVALTRLLNAFAYCGFVLDPAVLVRSSMVVSDITCLPYIFSHQDESVIPYLLKTGRSEELSPARQILFGRMAAELTLRYKGDVDAVKRFLHYMSEKHVFSERRIMFTETLSMLEAGVLEVSDFPILIDLNIKNDLPERPPPKVIGGGGTLRRPVAKVGRNDPCHCGSGKKYKRCCQDKDSELLADASEYAGITQTQLLENPGIVDDPHLINGMRAYEIKKLDPSTLGGCQLIAAHRRAAAFGLFDIAFSMLVECSGRTDLDFDFDPGHFVDLMEQALSSGRMDVAESARQLVPQDYDLIDWDDVNMQFELHSTPGVMSALEKRCAAALNPDEEFDFFHDYDLSNLAHILRGKFPALSILFARAAVAQCPERVMDNELLVEIVHECRDDLGLEPWDDPIDQMVYKGEREYQKKHRELKHADVESELRGELAAAREQAKLSAKRLTDAESYLQEMKKELAATEKSKDHSEEKPAVASGGPSSEQRETMERLRRQIDNLKVEVGNQQEQRRKLRQQLEKEQRSGRSQKTAGSDEKRDESDEQVAMPPKKERRIIIPEYKDLFRDACGNMPAAVAGGALKAISGIASYDEASWRNFRSIKRLPNIYRMRIGIHYRLLLRWLPGESLCALDLIPRQDLESWIKRHDV